MSRSCAPHAPGFPFAIMATARADDRTEFEGLLAPHLGRAYATALRLTRNAADAEDLVQDAALFAFRGFGTFERGTNFGAWYLRVLMNAFLSGKRKHRPEDHGVSLDELPSAFMQRRAHELVRAGGDEELSGGDVVRTVMGRLETEQVEAAIDALPDEFRAVAALYFLNDLPYREIADMLKIPVGTVRSRLHRGRALLQKRLWEIAVDEGLIKAGQARRA
jgi:RNA polymerase sigma-70 factor, ECF subfamily